jgi:hypothetical protein
MLAWTAVPIPAAELRPEIVRVEQRAEVSVQRGTGGDLAGRRLPKFLDGAYADPVTVFHVHWLPPPGGMQPPVKVVLAYRLAGERRIRTAEKRYPFIVRGDQQVRIEVPGVQSRDALGAWRVRILHGSVVVAERASAKW